MVELDSFNVGFGRRLSELLAVSGMTQAELGRRTGIRSSRISDFVSGKHCPNLPNLVLIARALDADVNKLLGLEAAHSPYGDGTLALLERMDDVGRQKVFDYARDLFQSGNYARVRAER